MEKRAFFLLTALASSAAFAVPTVSNVTWSQPAGGGRVTITYQLTGAPAVVTLDILTNANDAAEGVSIGAKNMWNVTGDVNRYIAEDDTYTITWQPHKSWPDQAVSDASVRAKVTAYDPAHPPAYMVVDLMDTGTDRRVSYYECEDALPGGVGSDVYRTTKMAFRRIDAAEVPWTYGSQSEIGGASGNPCCSVVLPDDYYMGIFEVTRAQWAKVCTDRDNGFAVETAMRPQTKVSYVNIRCNAHNSTTWGPDKSMDDPSLSTNDPRVSPNASSFLGRFRTLTGLKADIPTDAQWEFAARAGNGAGYWGDGSPMLGETTCANLDRLSRYAGNGGTPAADSENYGKEQSQWTTSSGTAKVGSYAPNAWGLYDMHGNVREQCRDYWCTSGNAELYKHLADVFYTNGDNNMVVRGGGWKGNASGCSSSNRSQIKNYNSNGVTGADDVGFRVVAPVTAVK